MSNYEKLRAERNRLFPEALKLEFGCQILIYNEEKKWIYTVLHVDPDGASLLLDHKTLRNVWMQTPAGYEILGKPLEYSDILRALGTLELFEVLLGSDGTLLVTKGDLEEVRIKFNLAVPLSHPDNDEACGRVIDLISKK